MISNFSQMIDDQKKASKNIETNHLNGHLSFNYSNLVMYTLWCSDSGLPENIQILNCQIVKTAIPIHPV